MNSRISAAACLRFVPHSEKKRIVPPSDISVDRILKGAHSIIQVNGLATHQCQPVRHRLRDWLHQIFAISVIFKLRQLGLQVVIIKQFHKEILGDLSIQDNLRLRSIDLYFFT